MNNDYYRYSISYTTEEEKNILIALLSDWGIEGFEEEEGILHASGPVKEIDITRIEQYLAANHFNFEKVLMKDQNWNAIWESNFQPVLVEDFVGVRAEFHSPISNVEHEIVITPKMSFGTGHHATTYLVMQLMRKIDFGGKKVFDYGTGTGILAILAEKLGAAEILAIDNDDWCIANSLENLEHNHCKKIEVLLETVPPADKSFDILLANINKNIILANLERILATVKNNGAIVLSGLLEDDKPDVLKLMAELGQEMIKNVEKSGWIAIFFRKSGL